MIPMSGARKSLGTLVAFVVLNDSVRLMTTVGHLAGSIRRFIP